MLALSIHQPEAILLLTGFCRLHVRNWTTSHRGPIAIHAARHMRPQDEELLQHPLIQQHLEAFNLKLHYGAIIGQIDLKSIVPTTAVWSEDPKGFYISKHDWLTNDFTAGDSIFVFEHPKRTRPYFAQGQRGLFATNFSPRRMVPACAR